MEPINAIGMGDVLSPLVETLLSPFTSGCFVCEHAAKESTSARISRMDVSFFILFPSFKKSYFFRHLCRIKTTVTIDVLPFAFPDTA